MQYSDRVHYCGHLLALLTRALWHSRLLLILAEGLVRLALGSVFPISLYLIVAMGSELVTGNIMYFTVALLERK
jgi:formate/nitrite transporter FocA (FNT family)